MNKAFKSFLAIPQEDRIHLFERKRPYPKLRLFSFLKKVDQLWENEEDD